MRDFTGERQHDGAPAVDMNSPLCPRDIKGEGRGKNMTRSVRDITRLLADDRIFKGRHIGTHLAAKGFEWLPHTTIPPDAPCDEWDEALSNMNESEFVTTQTFDTFKWIAGGVGAALLGVLGWIFARLWPISTEAAEMKAMLIEHIQEDERRHELLDTRLAIEHKENQARQSEMEARLVMGQATMMTEIHRVGDLLHRYILPRERRDQ